MGGVVSLTIHLPFARGGPILRRSNLDLSFRRAITLTTDQRGCVDSLCAPLHYNTAPEVVNEIIKGWIRAVATGAPPPREPVVGISVSAP
jgi:hypothetical protein